MWNPDPRSIWARENIELVIVEDDNVEAKGTCVGFERAVYNINKVSENEITRGGAKRRVMIKRLSNTSVEATSTL